MQTIKKVDRILDNIDSGVEWEEITSHVQWKYKQWQIMQRRRIEREERIKLRSKWHVGQRVKFQDKGSCRMGVIIKCNPKRAKIQTYVGQPKGGIWNVPYRFLVPITTKEDMQKLAIGKLQL